MARKYLIDTNIAIYYLNDELPEVTANEMDKKTVCMSVITRMELLAWRGATADELLIIESFINKSTVHNLEERIILKAIEVRRNYSIKLPDAIIAATSFAYGYILITRNESDFKNIQGLEIMNPWKKKQE